MSQDNGRGGRRDGQRPSPAPNMNDRSARGTPKDNYRITATVCMTDARKLQLAGSHRNACYLAGYVVECIIKVLIQCSGGERLIRSHKLDQLADQLAKLSLTAGARAMKCGDPRRLAPTITGPREGTSSTLKLSECSCDWNPDYRYDGSHWDNPAKSSAYITEAQQALDMLDQVALDQGLV